MAEHRFPVSDVHVYRMPSDTDGAKVYEVILGDGFGRCTCDGFRYRNSCKHLSRVFTDWKIRVADANLQSGPEVERLPFAVVHVPAGELAVVGETLSVNGPVRVELFRAEEAA